MDIDQDTHPCETCLRWDECNGVDWPACQRTTKEPEMVTFSFDSAILANLAIDIAEVLNERKRRGLYQ